MGTRKFYSARRNVVYWLLWVDSDQIDAHLIRADTGYGYTGITIFSIGETDSCFQNIKKIDSRDLSQLIISRMFGRGFETLRLHNLMLERDERGYGETIHSPPVFVRYRPWLGIIQTHVKNVICCA